VELYSCGCCNDEEPCPHGYGYEEVDVGDFDGQSTITLSKTQKRNLKRRAKRKKYNGIEECNEIEPSKKKMWSTDVRRNGRNYWKCEFEIHSLQGDMAKKIGCTIAHLLSNDELEVMKEKGTVVVHVTKPYYPKYRNGKKGKEIYWTVVGELSSELTGSLIEQSMVIVTTYNQVQHDERF